MQQIEAEHERNVNQLVWNPTGGLTAPTVGDLQGIYGASVADIGTDGTSWDSAVAQMKKDVLTAKMDMYKKSGYSPNIMLIPDEVFSVIATQDNEIKKALQYTSFGSVTQEILARYFEMDQVIIPAFLEDAEDFAETENKELMFNGDHVGLFHVNPTDSKNKTTLASTFYLDEGYEGMKWLGTDVEYNKKRKGEEVTVSAYWDLKMIDPSCGYILANLLSA
jgi:hypothetical protein